MSLDEAERLAIEQIESLRREYELRIAPYIKILSDIRAIRPHVYYVPIEGGKLAEMVPLSMTRNDQGGAK
jgi:hypothetical protein